MTTTTRITGTTTTMVKSTTTTIRQEEVEEEGGEEEEVECVTGNSSSSSSSGTSNNTTSSSGNEEYHKEEPHRDDCNKYNDKYNDNDKDNAEAAEHDETEDQKRRHEIHTRSSLFHQLQQTAQMVAEEEPFLAPLLKLTVLHPSNDSLASVVARTIAVRLLSPSCAVGGGVNGSATMPALNLTMLIQIFLDTMESCELEHGHTMLSAIQQDILACVQRDPACNSPLDVLLFYKGFASLVCHRAARRKWKCVAAAERNITSLAGHGSKSICRSSGVDSMTSSRVDSHHTSEHGTCSNQKDDMIIRNKKSTAGKYVSLWLQSQASAVFGVDIHPGAEIGAGVMFDHGTGIVIGETATVGDHCTFLHGVTLGGTGKHHGDRHPKVGSHVLIGAGACILGNIRIGDGCKIGAGSVVLKPIPHGATAVGAPARIIGFAGEDRPGSSVDVGLEKMVPIGGLLGTVMTNMGENISNDEKEDEDEQEHTQDHINKADERRIKAVHDDEFVLHQSNALNQVQETLKHENMSFTEDFLPRNSSHDEVNQHDSKQHRPDPDRALGRKKLSNNSNASSICAFRFFRCKGLPVGALSFQCLSELLSDHCTEDEIGEVYMSLLKLNPSLGYIPADVFAKEFPNVALKYTALDLQECNHIMTNMRKRSMRSSI